MNEVVLLLLVVGVLVILVLQLLAMGRRVGVDLAPMQSSLVSLEKADERIERTLCDEISRNRAEASSASRESREELARTLKATADSLNQQLVGGQQGGEAKLEQLRQAVERQLQQIAQDSTAKLESIRAESAAGVSKVREEVASSLQTFNQALGERVGVLSSGVRVQLEQVGQHVNTLAESNEKRFETLRSSVDERLKAIQEDSSKKIDHIRGEMVGTSKQTREEVSTSLKAFNDSVLKLMTQLGEAQRLEMAGFGLKIETLTQSNQQKVDELKTAVDIRLKAMQEDNGKQLEQMRITVDEKLQGTLEKRLGESFQQVSERLEQVYRGLGEMQALATGVGDLKKVLSNVKTRGTWGEVQLGALLEQVLSPNQYAANVSPKDNGERVEFAVKMPGRGGEVDEVVWLPIDAKFPVEDYQRLVDAQDQADVAAMEAAAEQLEARIKQCAKDISEKYVSPPQTTDFGILFLPTEGLFSEVIRRQGLTDVLQQKHRVVIAGPTTLWSILTSLQMGFRTLAIQKRSSEVWQLLAAVKTEWTKYGEVLEKVKKQLQTVTHTMDQATVRTRAIGRKLRDVEELPSTDAEVVLRLHAGAAEDFEGDPVDA